VCMCVWESVHVCAGCVCVCTVMYMHASGPECVCVHVDLRAQGWIVWIVYVRMIVHVYACASMRVN